jgi:hypothetical protein
MWRRVVSFTPGALYLGERAYSTNLDRRLGSPDDVKRRIVCPYREQKPDSWAP